jgi:hypothetical protein
MNYGFALESEHTAPMGRIVSPLAAGGTSTANVATHASATTTGNAQVATVPTTSMTTFGNVGLPLTILAAVALVLIGVLYLRRQKAKKARAAAAARVAAAETVRVALPADLATATKPKVTVPKTPLPKTPMPKTPVPDNSEAITQAMPAVPRSTAPMQPVRGARSGQPVQPVARAPRQLAPRQAQHPSTTTAAPEWPSGPEWPT